MNYLLTLLALSACTPESTTPEDVATDTVTTDVATDVVSTDAPVETFNTPESALWSVTENSYFVSNIAGESDAADGIGWIAKLDANGDTVDARWVDGLHAPKGMALSGNALYVADLTDLVEINATTGEIISRIPVPGAAFLNDVTASDDSVWISDTYGGAIFTYTPTTQIVEELVRDPALASINGLEYEGTRILGGTTGDFFDLEDLGNVVSIAPDTGVVTVLAEGVAKIDGIVYTGDSFLATDFRGMLLSIDANGDTTVLEDLQADYGMLSAADLGYDPARNQVAIPDLFGSTIVFIDLGAR